MFIDQPILGEAGAIFSPIVVPEMITQIQRCPMALSSPAVIHLITEMKFTSHIVAGEAYLSSGNTKAALVQFEAALALKGGNFGVMLRQAQCYLRLADRSRLRDVAAKLYAQQPQSPWSHMAIGAAKQFFREPDAAAYFDEAGRIGRDRPEVQLWLGEIAFRLNQMAKAELHYKAALELRSDLAPAIANLGVVKLVRGEPAEAERHLRSAWDCVTISRGSPPSWYRSAAAGACRECQFCIPDFANPERCSYPAVDDAKLNALELELLNGLISVATIVM